MRWGGYILYIVYVLIRYTVYCVYVPIRYTVYCILDTSRYDILSTVYCIRPLPAAGGGGPYGLPPCWLLAPSSQGALTPPPSLPHTLYCILYTSRYDILSAGYCPTAYFILYTVYCSYLILYTIQYVLYTPPRSRAPVPPCGLRLAPSAQRAPPPPERVRY